MKCVELNKKGDFDRWDQNHLKELASLKAGPDNTDYVIYQNDGIKLSVFGLEPYERIPFRVIKNDFNLFCLTGGLAISRSSDGGISLLMFEKGENVHRTIENTVMVKDLQNIGEDLLLMAIIEYLPTYEQDKYLYKIPEREAAYAH